MFILEVACFFENQSMGVLLRTRGISVTGLPVIYNDKNWHQRSVSRSQGYHVLLDNHVVGLSWYYPYIDFSQSYGTYDKSE